MRAVRSTCCIDNQSRKKDLMTERFAPLDTESAPARAKDLVRASEKRFGFLPSPIAKAARSPALLAHLLAGFAAFDRSSLTPDEREVVAFTVAYRNGCEVCIALHTSLLAKDPGHASFVAALREGRPLDDMRLEALRRFVVAVHEDHGRVSDAAWDAFARAGYGEEQALDVVLGVGVYELSTATNILSGAEVDAAFAPYAWTRA
jgi:AhpD family alkylhydroperoxidase